MPSPSATMHGTRFLRALLVPPLLLFAAPRPASAQSCTALPLSDGVVVTAPHVSRSWVSIPESAGWAVVALQGGFQVGDWDLHGCSLQAPVGPPDCYGPPVSSSTWGQPIPDVVGWRSVPAGGAIAEIVAYEGAGAPQVEYDGSPALLGVDAPPQSFVPAAGELVFLHAFDVAAGATVTLVVDRPTPPFQEVGPHGFFLRPDAPQHGGGWRVVGPTGFTATTTGRHALAVAQGEPSYVWPYSISVSSCPPPLPLPADLSGEGRFHAPPGWTGRWSAAAARSDGRRALTVYRDPAGGAPPRCFAFPLGADSADAGDVAFLAARDTSGFAPSRWLETHRLQGGPAPARVTATSTLAEVVPGGSPVALAFTSADVIQLVQAPLIAGRSYEFVLQPPPGTGWRMLVFPDPQQPGRWLRRAEAPIDASTSGSFVAPADGPALVAVLNQASGSGTAQVSVIETVVGVDGGPDARARILDLVPNPTMGSARLRFAVPGAGRALVRLVDAAGRKVGQEEIAIGGLGIVAVELSALAAGRLRAGHYFVTLDFDGRPAGRASLVVLPPARGR